MRVLAGTSGFSYDEWRGPFYPQELPGDGMLAYYAGQLPAVEINNTFYRMPSRKVLAGWAEAVPEAFRFALKASRKITHFKKLREVGDDVAYLVEVSATLGARRGPLLFQLPPWLKKDLPLLRDFLDALPAGVAAALEVRSDSWHDAAVYQALAERGVALAVVDDEKQGEPPLVATAPFGYARLRRPGYDDAELRGWAQRFAAQPWQEVHVFFKHEDAGAGPVLARRFLALAGEPSGEPRAPAAG